jgi:hypothetical protein
LRLRFFSGIQSAFDHAEGSEMADFDPKEWDWWEAARSAVERGEGHLIGKDEIPITEDPMTGFYRFRTYSPDGPFIPVQFWYGSSSGQLFCTRDGNKVEENVARGNWSWSAKHPITEEHYQAFLDSKKNPATPKGVWWDEIQVTSTSGKIQSSHTQEPVKAAPKKRGRPRANPEVVAASNTVEKIIAPAAPVEETTMKPDVPHHTLADGTIVLLPEDATVVDGVILDWCEDEIDPSTLPVWRPPAADEPVMRYWTRKSTAETFASTDDHTGDKDYRELDESNYRAIQLLKPTPKSVTRYWYHPESDSSYSTDDGLEQTSDDGMLEEITREKFNELQDLKAAQPAMDLDQAPVSEAPKVTPMVTPMVDDAPPARGIGDNSGVTEFDQWKDDTEEWTRRAKDLAKKPTPKTKEEANVFADVISKLADFLRDGDAMRLEEKRPLLAAAKAVDTKFKPIADAAEDGKRAVARVYEPYVQAAEKAERERVDRENAERQARVDAENAEAARKAAELGEAAPAAKVARPAKAKGVGAGTRRAVPAVTIKVAVVEDIAKASAFFATMEGGAPDDLIDVIKRLGKKAMDGGVKVPGMRLAESTGVR